ncbi:MAG: SAM-dependent methyltransferase, partial [Vogesella sp.]|uniref:SAM-dependent methyltransferase n=1 Tax=Vogesella sp. TaxID=1904252 RepID=UPI003F3A4B1E
MKRVDLLLVEQGLAPSRTAAQQLIEAGRVSVAEGVGTRVIGKASQKLPDDAVFHIVPDEADRYVSRGGLKMAGALAAAGLDDIQGWRALDVGQSTGGFSDCLLQAGVRRVVGVDVGHDQLAARLRSDARVRY